jgi:hypothetical protein
VRDGVPARTVQPRNETSCSVATRIGRRGPDDMADPPRLPTPTRPHKSDHAPEKGARYRQFRPGWVAADRPKIWVPRSPVPAAEDQSVAPRSRGHRDGCALLRDLGASPWTAAAPMSEFGAQIFSVAPSARSGAATQARSQVQNNACEPAVCFMDLLDKRRRAGRRAADLGGSSGVPWGGATA